MAKVVPLVKHTTTQRTTDGLREALFQELDALRSGKSNPHRASAVAKLAVQIINTTRLEIDWMSIVNQNDATLKSVSLPQLKFAASA